MYKIIIISFILLHSVLCQGQDPAEIVRKSHDAVKISSFEALSTLSITDSRGNVRIRENTMASKAYADGTEKRIIKFTSPAEVKGTGILIFDYEDKADDMWIYLPALRKTRRIVSSEKSNSFMGSEFSNGDMSAPKVEDFDYELTGEETVNGIHCWKIKARPKNINLEDEYGYTERNAWIGKNDYIVQKTEYYDYDNQVIKTIETVSYELLEKAAGKYMVTEMYAVNHQNGRSSRMKMDEIQITATNENYFTVNYLER
ncbi:MAG: outer membrane lipoprotein-sorting protein [Bacteroidales bacterium]|nr:outer membrane lipoprotein-sorting protein [Bacteroidales bacterium]